MLNRLQQNKNRNLHKYLYDIQQLQLTGANNLYFAGNHVKYAVMVD